MEIIGERLRQLRESMKLSQSKMAKILNVGQSSIDRYERGNSTPSAETFLKYADYFDVSMDFIFGRVGEPQGKLYEYRPRVEKSNPEMKQFIEMCFDPDSPMSERLKETLLTMLEEGE